MTNRFDPNSGEFDPQLLLRTYLDLLPKQIDAFDPGPESRHTEPRARFYDAMGLTPEQVAASLVNHDLDGATLDLVEAFLDPGYRGSDDELDRLDTAAERLYFDDLAATVKKLKATESPRSDAQEATDFDFEPAEVVIREPLVQALPPSEAGSDWWVK